MMSFQFGQLDIEGLKFGMSIIRGGGGMALVKYNHILILLELLYQLKFMHIYHVL